MLDYRLEMGIKGLKAGKWFLYAFIIILKCSGEDILIFILLMFGKEYHSSFFQHIGCISFK